MTIEAPEELPDRLAPEMEALLLRVAEEDPRSAGHRCPAVRPWRRIRLLQRRDP
jgi:hypothetical protein